jgi:K+-transporting ATPase ATPase A chain
MNPTTAGAIFIASLVIALAVAYRPLGDYMYRILTTAGHARVERVVYRAVGVNPEGEQSWGFYVRSVLAFSAVSVLFLYAFQRLQNHLWLSLGFPPVKADQAWNTAVSFVTNTNWQSYSGESTMGHLVQMAGLAVQNFVSAAVGVAVAVALVRGFARHGTTRLGNFWVDLVRIVLRILLPIAVVGAIVFVAAGMVQNLSAGIDVHTLAGAIQHVTGGPVASQEVIKELGTNGGGFYNANSAHPFENPTTWTNWIEIFLLLVISFSLPRTFGRMVGDNRQGYAIAAIMGILAVGSVIAVNALQLHHGGTVPQAIGAATEGTETRFGVPQSATFAATALGTGRPDSVIAWNNSAPSSTASSRPSRRVAVSDAVLEVELHGSGEPMMLIQTALTADEFRPLAGQAPLQGGYRLVLITIAGMRAAARSRGPDRSCATPWTVRHPAPHRNRATSIKCVFGDSLC